MVSPNFAITSDTLNGTNLVVCWQSTIGYSYDVLTNINLAVPAGWTPVNPTQIIATNSITCYTLPGGVTNTNVFVVIRGNQQ